MKTPNKMIRREDPLAGFEDSNDMPGKLVWSIGYFQKAPLVKELERAPTAEEAKAAPQPAKTPPEMEMMPLTPPRRTCPLLHQMFRRPSPTRNGLLVSCPSSSTR
jgi:hypothetical protein